MDTFEVIQPPVHTAPIGAPPAWEAVMNRSGGRCQCTGACGRTHSRTEFRCDRHHDRGGVRLVVAPADLTLKPAEAARVPVPELRAWCPECLQMTRRRQTDRARAYTRLAAPADDTTPTLFDL